MPVLIADFIPQDRRGLGMGVLAVASGVSIVLGPTVGGVITDLLSWEWIFLVNIPFGIFTVLLALKVLPVDEGYEKSANPDVVNSLLIVFCLACTMMFVQGVADKHVPTWAVYSSAPLAIVMVLALCYRIHRDPDTCLVPVGLLKRRDFQLLCLAFTMTCMVIMGTQYALPYFLQVGGGYSVSGSGLLLSVASVFAILLSVPVGRWCDTRGCRIPSILAGVGRLAFCLIFMYVTPKTDFALLIAGLVVMGCSMAMAGTGLSTAVIHHSNLEHQGDAATMVMEINYVAASLGVAVYSLVFDTYFGDLPVGKMLPDVMDRCFDQTMVIGALLSVVAIVCALAVKNVIPEQRKKD